MQLKTQQLNDYWQFRKWEKDVKNGCAVMNFISNCDDPIKPQTNFKSYNSFGTSINVTTKTFIFTRPPT